MQWIIAGSIVVGFLSLWLFWELVRSAVRRGVIEANAHEGPPPERDRFAIALGLIVVLVIAAALGTFLSGKFS